MSRNELCFLCFSKCNNGISLVNSKVSEQQLKEVIKQHFWFEFSDDSTEHEVSVLCSNCFDKVKVFHEFYTNIRDIHFPFKYEAAEIRTDDLEHPIKTESDMKIDEPELSEEESVLQVSNDSNSDIDNLSDKNDVDYNLTSNEDADDDSNYGNDDTVKEILRRNRRKLKFNNYHKKFQQQRDKLKLYFRFYCDLCSLPLTSLAHSKDHYETVHERRGYLICCERRFYHYNQIFEHLHWHDNPDAFKCTQCNSTFMDGTSLRRHTNETHNGTDSGPFKCSDCDKVFGRKTSLKIHIGSKHPKDGKKFKCSECDAMFGLERVYRTHFKAVHQTSLMCDICAKIFKCRQSYERHNQVEHTNTLEKVQCDTCGVWLKHSISLKSHIREVHNRKDKTPIKCVLCDKMYNNRKSLNRHNKSMHSSVQYPCEYCDKIFKRPENLKEHVAIHMGITDLYTCLFCPKTFRSNANMSKHRKQAHRIEWEKAKLSGNKFKPAT